MKYPEHISEFWRMRSADGSLTNTDFIVFAYLCNCCNNMFWSTDRVTQRRDLICGFLNIGASALEESRNRLKQKGLIDFIAQTQVNKAGKRQGVKGSATTYIVLNSELNGQKSLNSVSNSVKDSVLNRTPIRHETDTKQTLNPTVLRNINSNENLNEIKEDKGKAADAARDQRIKQLELEIETLKDQKKEKPTPDSASPPSKRFVKPTFEEVKSYYTEKTGVNGKTSEGFAQKFVSYYESNGWKVGKNGMKDWQAAVRTWLQNDYSNGKIEKLAPSGVEPKNNGRFGKL